MSLGLPDLSPLGQMDLHPVIPPQQGAKETAQPLLNQKLPAGNGRQ